MKNYKKMIIKKTNIMPLIQNLAKAYNTSTDDEFIILENTKDSWFVLFDDADNPIEMEPKPKCGDCKYLDIDDKRSIGYKCNRPNFRRSYESAAWKQKSTAACKGFERKEI